MTWGADRRVRANRARVTAIRPSRSAARPATKVSIATSASDRDSASGGAANASALSRSALSGPESAAQVNRLLRCAGGTVAHQISAWHPIWRVRTGWTG